MTAKTYSIHPAIGVARLGNLPADLNDPSTWYLAPETPYEVANEGRDYKSADKVTIKKQAQRFRIYEYSGGTAIREITLEESDVTGILWSVHMANWKAGLQSSDKVAGITPSYSPALSSPRNPDVADRSQLRIDSGVQTVGTGTASMQAMNGSITFPYSGGSKTKNVTLGQIATEPNTGRLLVFGGSGVSQGLTGSGSFSSSAPTHGTFDNSSWFDDSSDGIITATITFSDQSVVTLNQSIEAARVLVGVPGYAPAMNCFTSLYDVAMSAWNGTTVSNPSFAKEIYPILASTVMLQWVSDRAALGHANGKQGDFLSAANLALLSDNNKSPTSSAYIRRKSVFDRVANPSGGSGMQDMPLLTYAKVTAMQYARLTNWSTGDFIADGVPTDMPFKFYPIPDQPGILDRSSLTTTIGTAFYPGIEAWNIMANKLIYDDPLHVKLTVVPGQLTMGNALPWQTDYQACGTGWWPSQRPNQVWAKVGARYRPSQSWVPSGLQMLTDWNQLGFIIQKAGKYVETEASDDIVAARNNGD